MKEFKAAIFLDTGYETGEATITIDLLRRAKISLDIVSVNNNKYVASNHNVKIECDKLISELNFDNYQLLILPGGDIGVKNLQKSNILCEQLKKFADNKKMLAAICAAPQILGKLGLVDNKKVSFFPGSENGLDKAIKSKDSVSVADNIITSKSLGTAFNFALAIIEKVLNKEEMLKVLDQVKF